MDGTMLDFTYSLGGEITRWMGTWFDTRRMAGEQSRPIRQPNRPTVIQQYVVIDNSLLMFAMGSRSTGGYWGNGMENRGRLFGDSCGNGWLGFSGQLEGRTERRMNGGIPWR